MQPMEGEGEETDIPADTGSCERRGEVRLRTHEWGRFLGGHGWNNRFQGGKRRKMQVASTSQIFIEKNISG